MIPDQAYTVMPYTYETKTNQISLHTLKHLFTCKISRFDIPFKSLCLSKLLQFLSRHTVSHLGRICFHVEPERPSHFSTAWMASMCAVYHDSTPKVLEDFFEVSIDFLGGVETEEWPDVYGIAWLFQPITINQGYLAKTRTLAQRLISDLTSIISVNSKFLIIDAS